MDERDWGLPPPLQRPPSAWSTGMPAYPTRLRESKPVVGQQEIHVTTRSESATPGEQDGRAVGPVPPPTCEPLRRRSVDPAQRARRSQIRPIRPEPEDRDAVSPTWQVPGPQTDVDRWSQCRLLDRTAGVPGRQSQEATSRPEIGC